MSTYDDSTAFWSLISKIDVSKDCEEVKAHLVFTLSPLELKEIRQQKDALAGALRENVLQATSKPEWVSEDALLKP